MATKKQRRRLEKQRRHEWEEVWVDDEGHEVEPPPEADRPAPRKAETAKARPATRNARAMREVSEPSWERAFKRAATFAPLIVLAVYFLNKPADRTVVKLAYTTALLIGFFVPFTYLMDRVMYRAYLKRTGKLPSPPAKKRD